MHDLAGRRIDDADVDGDVAAPGLRAERREEAAQIDAEGDSAAALGRLELGDRAADQELRAQQAPGLNRLRRGQAPKRDFLLFQDRSQAGAFDNVEAAGPAKLADHHGGESAAHVIAAVLADKGAVGVEFGHGDGLFRPGMGRGWRHLVPGLRVPLGLHLDRALLGDVQGGILGIVLGRSRLECRGRQQHGCGDDSDVDAGLGIA